MRTPASTSQKNLTVGKGLNLALRKARTHSDVADNVFNYNSENRKAFENDNEEKKYHEI